MKHILALLLVFTSVAFAQTAPVTGRTYPNPANTTITGGAINNTPIGGTTPAAGAFTTLSTTGAYTLGANSFIQGNSGVVNLLNSTNPQALRVFNTFTDASNNEYGRVEWTGNTFAISTVANGSGTSRALQVGTEGNTSMFLRVNASARWGVDVSGGGYGWYPVADNTAPIGGPSNRVSVDYVVQRSGKQVVTGTTPTIGACGTSPSVAGNDNAMLVTVGTGGVATTCAVNFSAAWTTNAPVCVAQSSADATALTITVSTTVVTVTKAAPFTASSLLNILCTGRL